MEKYQILLLDPDVMAARCYFAMNTTQKWFKKLRRQTGMDGHLEKSH